MQNIYESKKSDTIIAKHSNFAATGIGVSIASPPFG